MAVVKGVDWQKLVIDVLLRDEASPPTTYYLGLGTGALPAATDDLAAVAAKELAVANGYARMSLSRGTTDFGTPSLTGSIWRVIAETQRFIASGSWAEVNFIFLTDAASGTSGRFLGAGDVDAATLGVDEFFDAVFEYLGAV